MTNEIENEIPCEKIIERFKYFVNEMCIFDPRDRKISESILYIFYGLWMILILYMAKKS